MSGLLSNVPGTRVFLSGWFRKKMRIFDDFMSVSRCCDDPRQMHDRRNQTAFMNGCPYQHIGAAH